MTAARRSATTPGGRRRFNVSWGQRTVIRGIPGFNWWQICFYLHRRPHKPTHDWLVPPLVRRHDLGTVIVLTMRTDALQRAGIDPASPVRSTADLTSGSPT